MKHLTKRLDWLTTLVPFCASFFCVFFLLPFLKTPLLCWDPSASFSETSLEAFIF